MRAARPVAARRGAGARCFLPGEALLKMINEGAVLSRGGRDTKVSRAAQNEAARGMPMLCSMIRATWLALHAAARTARRPSEVGTTPEDVSRRLVLHA